jgi:flagellar basal-body rod modification protein FlgD
MFLEAISGAASLGRKSAGDSQRIAENFDAFLLLLTTQLRNQNPLDPLDTNQFTQQLVQFAGVEQSIRTNENLELLVKVSAANAATAAASFIGKKITVGSTRSELQDGRAEWTYNAAANAPSATFIVRDESGKIVWQEERNVIRGRDTFVWNGHAQDGSKAPDGRYHLSVEAKNADGQVVKVDVEVSARIDGVDFSGSEPKLLAAGREVPLSEVRSVTN